MPAENLERANLIGWLIGPVLLLCAAWMFWGSGPDADALPDRVVVDPASLATEAPREMMAMPPKLDVAGFEKKCMECHALFKLNPEQPLLLSQHRDIVQGHGMNDRCFNCHSSDDPSLLVKPDGKTLTFDQTPQLCATCHGTTYRDWQSGIHGRSTGSWDTQSPDRGMLSCTECHDPHAPAFGAITLFPGPNTRLLGDHFDEPRQHHGGTRNPLRQWSSGQDLTDHEHEGEEH